MSGQRKQGNDAPALEEVIERAIEKGIARGLEAMHGDRTAGIAYPETLHMPAQMPMDRPTPADGVDFMRQYINEKRAHLLKMWDAKHSINAEIQQLDPNSDKCRQLLLDLASLTEEYMAVSEQLRLRMMAM